MLKLGTNSNRLPQKNDEDSLLECHKNYELCCKLGVELGNLTQVLRGLLRIGGSAQLVKYLSGKWEVQIHP